MLKYSVTGNATYAHVNSNLFGILLRDTTEEEIMEMIGAITAKLKDYSESNHSKYGIRKTLKKRGTSVNKIIDIADFCNRMGICRFIQGIDSTFQA